jgi:hypothetical protein
MTNSSNNRKLLDEILSDVRELEKKIKAIDVLPNWELGLKNDLLRHIKNLDYGVSDFIVSEEAEA